MDDIYLLTENTHKYNWLRNILHTDLPLLMVDKKVLLNRMYENQPALVIIDLDSYDETTLISVNSFLSFIYLPTICLAEDSSHAKKVKFFKDSVVLLPEHTDSTLHLLIQQALKFSKQYTSLNKNYNTLDFINEYLKTTLNTFIHTNDASEPEVIHKYLKTVFTNPKFQLNTPKVVWLLYEYNAHPIASVFYLNDDSLNYETHIAVDDMSALVFDESVKSGYFKNLSSNHQADHERLAYMIPKTLLSLYSPKKNIVIYGTEQLTVMALDYQQGVSTHEVTILQALAIKLDLMNHIKYTMMEVQDAFKYTMNALARAAEVKDDMTGHHIKRVNAFTKILAEELHIDHRMIHELEIAAQMHDVGKIYIDESILTKPGKLTQEEFNEIKMHTIYGEKIIGDSTHLSLAAQIARSHHEKFDGSGYPDGKKGDEIPLPARIVALADIYDALRSRRTYKPGFSHEESYHIITEGDGRVEPSHFDPKVLAAFKKAHEKFRRIYDLFQDEF